MKVSSLGETERLRAGTSEFCFLSRVADFFRLCSRSFKSILHRLEADTVAGIPISGTLQESRELASLRTVYSMNGFPLNLAFTDTNAILSTVYNTDVHSNSEKGIEFAVAVHCIGYPGRFMSVWVYVASLTKSF